MIKLDYEAVRDEKNEGYKVRCEGSCIGNHAELLAELEAALESFDEQMPDLLQAALDMFLSKRGFNMVKAKVNGVECTVYDFIRVDGFTICRVAYPHYNILLPVLAELIEVSYEAE